MSALGELWATIGWRLRNSREWLKTVRAGRESSAREYWSDADRPDWQQNSHWRDAPISGWVDRWDEIGRTHLAMYERFARMVPLECPGRIVEWGVGGGANAVQFAPLCDAFVAVDVARESLKETVRQVGMASDTPVEEVLVAIDDQGAAVAEIGTVDLFLCFYVLELVPTESHAHEIVRIAHDVLRPGGAAILQTKYKRSAPPRRPWRPQAEDLANQYTVDIADFWTLLTAFGFTVHYVEIRPRTPVDQNYAYFFATRA
jgi:SAM-dependent methyltransferase